MEDWNGFHSYSSHLVCQSLHFCLIINYISFPFMHVPFPPHFTWAKALLDQPVSMQLELRGQTEVPLTYLYANKYWSINPVCLKMKWFCSLSQIHNNFLLPHTQIKSTKPNQKDQNHRFLTFREILISIQQGNLIQFIYILSPFSISFVIVFPGSCGLDLNHKYGLL